MSIPYPEHAQSLKRLLDAHRAVTLISHVQPDADAIGTSLGIYHWLKAQGHRVEVVNASEDVPVYLDFLPAFSKIKTRMDFDDSLIIACDCGSVDRLGLDVSGRTIVNIDHHPTNTRFGALNVVCADAAASSEVAYRLLSILAPVSSQSATAFYAALVGDTRHFTTATMRREVLVLAADLVERGVDIGHVAAQMTQRRSLAALRMLGAAIGSLELVRDARVALVQIDRDTQHRWGARSSDLEGIVEEIRSLATVQIAVMLVERDEQIKVSLRSKGADVARIAKHFGGGGHRAAAGFEVAGSDMGAVREAILERIDREEGWR